MAVKRRNEILTGLFTLSGMILLLFLIVLMGGFEGMFTTETELEIIFEDVSGLSTGNPVLLFGKKEGIVRDVAYLPDDTEAPGKLLVTITFPEEHRHRIHETTLAVIDKSLTGSLSVLIRDKPGEQGPMLPHGARLVGSQAAEIGKIAHELNQLIVEGKAVMATVKSIVDNIEEKKSIGTALDNLAAMTTKLREKIDPLTAAAEKAIQSADSAIQSMDHVLIDNRESIKNTMANFEATSAKILDVIGNLEEVPTQITNTLTTLQQASELARGLIAQNKTGIDLIVEDLQGAAANAKVAIAEVRRQPWRLLYKPSTDEMKALELYDAAWAYNMGATELHRSVRVLTDRMRLGDKDPEQQKLLEKALERVRGSLETHAEAEDAFWKALKAGS